LKDPTKPGHCRVIKLWLVDPHQRIISTANVSPQRTDWWAEAVFGRGSRFSIGTMPPELFQVLVEQGATAKLDIPQKEWDKIRFANRLPAEIMNMVRSHRAVPRGIMTQDEARKYFLMISEERRQF
ncbi:hypothetical protein QBC34DRAFT_274390, partial [Podospora aff. communis PSN243]